MTVEEVLCELEQKYGEDFTWGLISPTDPYFVEELKKEVGAQNSLFHQEVLAVARSYASDDILFLIRSLDNQEVYRIYHLTYSSRNAEGYPRYKEFESLDDVVKFIEMGMQIFNPDS